MTDFAGRLAEFSTNFNAQLPQLFLLPDAPEKRVIEAMFYSLSGGGKRLRPFLVTASAALFDVSAAAAFRTAAALECLHTYSLIHDDLPAMDNDDLRRGRKTCHKQFDEATAILAGDGLLTYAFELISADSNPFDAAIRCQLVSLLAEASGAFGGMVAGQMLDLDTERNASPANAQATISRIEEMKTGRLLRFACEAGAVLGKASAQQRQALVNYARKIGIAFQITDDILDVEGTVEQMGKTLGKDAVQGKLTFVSLYGLDKAKAMAADLIAAAKAELSVFKDNAPELQALADFILSRRH